jgi:hypothetical protein
MIPAIPAVALAVLKSSTLWYCLGVLAVVSVIFIGGCNYGASGKAEIKAEFEAYKQQQESLLVAVQETNKVNALAANTRLIAEERKLEERDRQHQKELARIASRLSRTQLDLDTVRLFNSSAAANGPGQPFAPPEVGSNVPADEGTSTAQTPEPSGDTLTSRTLADLLAVSVENNKNHLACIAQVDAWQQFYNKLYERFE